LCFNIFQISFDISKFWYTEISSNVSYLIIGLGLWCLMPLSITFQLYCGGQFYWWRKPKYPEKTPTCHKLLTNFITQCCIESYRCHLINNTKENNLAQLNIPQTMHLKSSQFI
jgi:hypothetical protein